MKTMKTVLIALMLAAPLAFNVGCSTKVAETSKTTEDSNGNVKSDSKTVYQNPDGTTTTVKQQDQTNNH